jgi:uncharacterized metal-binding protein YceD (DUF177 family)
VKPDTPEFSRRVQVGDVRARGSDYEITADSHECAALARRFAIVEVRGLTARLRLQPIGGGPVVRMSGNLVADVVQSCVVTLEPVPAHLEERFDMTFGPAGEADDDDGEGEIDLSPEADDPPDPFVDGAIDVGEAVAEQLALALDPFPRAAGVAFTPPAEDVPGVPQKASPFAILARLRKNDG